MNNIDILIFSRDRACQLELLLRSMKDNLINQLPVGNIFVLYKCSHQLFKDGYVKLHNKCKKQWDKYIYFILEDNFEKDCKDIINDLDGKYFLCLVDDDCIINKPDINILKELNDETFCISLKMNESIEYCYPRDMKISKPEFIPCGDFLKWDWTKIPYDNDWGYSHSINGHIYKMDYFKNMINKISFDCPNNLEDAMNNAPAEDIRDYMISHKKTIVLNVPNNKVQTYNDNRNSMRIDFNAIDLNEKYLDNYIIDTSNIYGINNVSAHQEVEYHFIKEDK